MTVISPEFKKKQKKRARAVWQLSACPVYQPVFFLSLCVLGYNEGLAGELVGGLSGELVN